MIRVKLFKGEDINHALKRLRRRVQKEGTLQELFERKFYKSEGLKKREILKHAIYLNKVRSMNNNINY